MIETDAWPMLKARWYTPVTNTRRAVRVIVIHDMEAPEKGTTAEDVARYFATLPATTKASAHVCIDNNSIVQCVPDNSVAYGAPGVNNDGIQIELAGYGSQTREQWLDVYGQALLDLAANATAQYCLKYGVPILHLSDDELRDGGRGIIGHYQASAVYQLSDHTDPGPNFPWDYFLARVTTHYAERKNRLA